MYWFIYTIFFEHRRPGALNDSQDDCVAMPAIDEQRVGIGVDNEDETKYMNVISIKYITIYIEEEKGKNI